MNNNFKNVNNIPSVTASRSSSMVKKAKILGDELMSSNMFAQLVLVESIDNVNRTFRGTLYPHKFKNTLVDTSKKSNTVVDLKKMEQRCLGFIPETIDISSIVPNSSLVLVVATDLDVIETISVARKIKNTSASTANKVVSFRNHMDTYPPNSGRSEKSVIMVSKLLDF